MSESFEIPVEYKGKTINIPARIINAGYIHKIEIQINEGTVILEPDEEGSYRAIVESGNNNGQQQIDMELLGALIQIIEESSP